MSDNNTNIDKTGEPSGGGTVSITDTLINSISNISSSITSINNEMKAMRKEFDVIREENKRISLSVTSCENHLKKSLRELKDETLQFKKVIKNLEKENLLLKNELIQVKQSTNKAIKITNFPKTENESPVSVFGRICQYIKFDFNLEFIEDCYYLNVRNSKYPPMIVVKFLRDKDKSLLLKYLRENKIRLSTEMFVKENTNVPIYISEFLTREMGQLFAEARSLKRNNEVKYVWVRNSRIFVRISDNSEPKIIRSKLDLQQCLMPKQVGTMKKDFYEETDFEESDATDISEASKGSKKRKLKKIGGHEKIDRFFRKPGKKEK